MPQPEITRAHAHAHPPPDEDEPSSDLHDEEASNSPPEGIDFLEMEQRLRTAIVAHPFIALGTAVATGYLVGRLFRR